MPRAYGEMKLTVWPAENETKQTNRLVERLKANTYRPMSSQMGVVPKNVNQTTKMRGLYG